MKKKLFTMLLASLMVFTIAGCGNSTGKNTKEETTTEQQVEVSDLGKNTKTVTDPDTGKKTEVDTTTEAGWVPMAGRTGAYLDALRSNAEVMEDETVKKILEYADVAAESGDYEVYSCIGTKTEDDTVTYAYDAYRKNKAQTIVIVIVDKDGNTSVAEFTGDRSDIVGGAVETSSEENANEETTTTNNTESDTTSVNENSATGE